MGPVSVYRVGAVGADPSYFFEGEARDSASGQLQWIAWLLLTLVDFGGPGVAVADDAQITAPLGPSERPRRTVVGAVLSASDAVRELVARRDSGLPPFTNRPGDLLPYGPFCPSSLAVLVGDDLVAHVARLRAPHLSVVDGLDGVERQRAVLDASQVGTSGDSAVWGCCGRAARDLQEKQLQLHRLLEVVVRISVFDPAVGR